MEHQPNYLYSAYLDGELTAREAADLDEQLLPEERAWLYSDMEVEMALGRFFGQPAACPPTLWKTTLKQVKRQRPPSRRLWHWIGSPQALAVLTGMALFTFALLLFAPTQADFLTVPASSEACPLSVTEARDFLATCQVPVRLDPSNTLTVLEPPYILMSAHEKDFHGEQVVELVFLCDDEPAKVVIAPKSGAAANEIGKALAQGMVQASGTLDKVVVAVIGKCPPKDLIHIVDDKKEDAMDVPDPSPAPPSDGQTPSPASPEFDAGLEWLV